MNFASGGAGALTETHQGLAISLKTQVSNFKIVETQLKQKLGDAAAKTLVSNAVYLLDGGANDYIVALTTNSSVLRSIYSKTQYVDMVIGNLTTIVKEIYKKGGRKFGILNLGPMGCVPAMKELVPGFSGSCLEDGVELPKLHNKALSKALVQLESQLKGICLCKSRFLQFYIEQNQQSFKIWYLM